MMFLMAVSYTHLDTVDRIRRDIHSALESERHIRSPEIVIDGLRKSDHVESFLA